MQHTHTHLPAHTYTHIHAFLGKIGSLYGYYVIFIISYCGTYGLFIYIDIFPIGNNSLMNSFLKIPLFPK